jgi:NADH dehydrogenase
MILVNGGTGFIGSEVVKKFLARGVRVRVMTRNPDRGRKLFEGAEVEILRGSVKDLESLRCSMEGIQTVVNCVQHDNYPMEKPSKGLAFLEIDGAGTRNQVQAAVDSGVREFVYISGAGAGEGRAENWFRAKEVAERAVTESGLKYLIIRPTWVYGQRDKSVNKFVSFAKKLPLVPLIGDGLQKVQPLYVKDLADIISSTVIDNLAWGKTFDVGGPQVLTMRRLVETILEVLDKKKPVIPLPITLFKVTSKFMKYIPGSAISPEVIDFSLQEAVVDNTSLLEILKINLKQFKDGISEYIY